MFIKIKKSIPEMFFLILGITILIIIPIEINSPVNSGNGPRLFPYLLASLIVLLSIIIIITNIIKKNSKDNLNEEHEEVKDKPKYLRVILVIGCSFLWIAIIPILGVIIPTILTIFLSMWILGERKVIPLILVPLIVSFLVYYIFVVILGVRFVEGLFY